MTKHFTTSDGLKLAYSDEGEGLAVLCLSGLTRTMRDFDYMRPHLPPCRLIRMDYRGRGESDWSGADTYTVPQEAKDALALLDHLGVERVAIIGTSRGGLIGLLLAVLAKQRMLGLLMNDVGPVIERSGLERIFDYVGRNPARKTYAAAAEAMPKVSPGFANVPESRWREEVERHYIETAEGLRINYDPSLRQAFLAAFEGPPVDLWPLYDALAPLPVAVIRGANSDLLSQETLAEMGRRRPDLLQVEVPDRAHIPYLDEPQSIAIIHAFLKACQNV